MSQCVTYITINSVVKTVVLISLFVFSTASMAQNYSKTYKKGNVIVNYEYEDEEPQANRPSSSYSQSQGGYYLQNYQPGRFQLPVERPRSPVDLLEESINNVSTFLAQPQEASVDEITYFLHQEIGPHFDFNYMARWVAGRYFTKMSAEQQAEFTETFIGLFITTFVKKLTHFQKYPPVIGDFVSKRTSNNEATASVKVFKDTGGRIQVDFKFIKTPMGWKVIDVRANGISALLYYRNYFMEQIRRSNQQRATFN